MPQQISPLRQRMTDDMTIRNMSPLTQKAYVRAVKNLSLHFMKSPDKLTFENVREYHLHLISRALSTATRAGSGCLDRFPRTISGVLPGLLSLPHRGWDEGRAQPDRRSNPYAARKLSCRRRDWRRLEVSLVRGASVKARMRALSIVEVEIAAQRRASLCDRVVGFEIYLLVFHGFPEPLDENVVAPGALAVHADGDPVRE